MLEQLRSAIAVEKPIFKFPICLFISILISHRDDVHLYAVHHTMEKQSNFMIDFLICQPRERNEFLAFRIRILELANTNTQYRKRRPHLKNHQNS